MIDDFQITIGAEEPPSAGTNVSVQYAGGVRVGVFSMASVTDAVATLYAALQHPRAPAPQLEAAGRRLFDALFTGPILDAFRESLTLARSQRRRLRVRLFSDLPAVIAVPWEYLYDPVQSGWLTLQPDLSLVRALPLAAGEPLPVDGLLRVLVVVASPKDLPPLNSETEWESLENATAAAPVELVRCEPTYAGLLAALRQSPQVFHFVGHGVFENAGQQGYLGFEDENGKADPMSADKLAVLLGGCKTLRLAILNACEGAVTGTASAFAGVAQRLIQQRVPAVLAMQAPIIDQDAVDFSRELYGALADGLSLEQAVSEGRKRIYGGSQRWGIPTLYAQGVEPFTFPALSDADKAERLWQKIPGIEDSARRRIALTRILALDPTHSRAQKALERLGHAEKVVGLYAAAEANYQAGLWREAYRVLDQIERILPNYRDTRSLLAEVLGKLGGQPGLPSGYLGQLPQYDLILNALREGRLVPFLGWGVSRFGRPAQDAWMKGQYLPGADELAHVLAEPLRVETEGVQSLLQVSQYVSLLEGESVLYERLYALYAEGYPPTMLHRLLAELPARLGARGYPTNPNRRFVIFSMEFGDLLERAFDELGQAYHVFAYRHQTTDVNRVVHPGRFVHIPPGGEPIELPAPATYAGHDSDHLPVLVKLCGQRVTPEPENSVTITEDQYLGYLPAQEIGMLLPLTLLNQIKRRSFLLFGHSLRMWHFRLLWQRLKFQQSPLYEKAWAIIPDLNAVEQAFWYNQNVEPLVASPEGVVAYVSKWLETL